SGGTGGMPACDSTANAFIKTLDPDADFMVSASDIVDTTDLSTDWQRLTLSLQITADPDLVGHILQFGFQTNASDFGDSGVFYDNVELADPAVVYTQNFNNLDIGGTVIGDDWLYFVNVFDSVGTRKFGYNEGLFAPNGPQISALVTGEGGPTQEPQQLSVFSDYNCCQTTNEGHFNGTDLVETNVFQERTIVAGDVGTTFVFSVDAKRGNINLGCP
ncbi:MAG: hypothetical protein OES69_08020, partial [Myxococcales bacterium]|nr:hypothetical protein [Myxococcales bacterium]